MEAPTLETLENGLRVVLVPNSNSEGVTFGIYVQSGARHETPETSGISHFIEHMVFKGTKKHSQIEISRAIEGCGGMFNAWTSHEGTCFYARVPYERMKTAVSMISEVFREPRFDKTDFERERMVILEEIKMYDDDPESVAADNFMRLMFPGDQLGLPISGNADTLDSFTADTLREYHAKHYAPSATIAILLGNFEREAALDAIRGELGAIPSIPAPVFAKLRKIRRLPKHEIVVERRDIKQTQLAMGFRAFGANDPRRWKFAVFDAIMGRGMTSRLYQKIREKMGLSYDISTMTQNFQDTGFWSIGAGLNGINLAKAKSAIARELDTIRTKRVPAAELKRVKEFLSGNWRLGLELPRAQMFHYLAGVITQGRIVLPHEISDQIRATTADDILSIAQTVIVDDMRAESIVRPNQ